MTVKTGRKSPEVEGRVQIQNLQFSTPPEDCCPIAAGSGVSNPSAKNTNSNHGDEEFVFQERDLGHSEHEHGWHGEWTRACKQKQTSKPLGGGKRTCTKL